MDPNKEIVNYTDYRAFLKDYYLARKKQPGGYSYKTMASLAGFSSASFQRMVIEGDKNISVESVIKIARALKLNKKSSDYFETIVAFTQATDLETKEYYLEKIDRFRKRNKPELLLGTEYDYLKEWYHAVVRETVDLPYFTEDPKQLAKHFPLGMTTADVERSLEFLVSHGFLVRTEDGKLVKKDKTLATDMVPNNDELILIAKRYHLAMLVQAQKAVTTLPKESRSISNTTLSVSKACFDACVKRIETLRYELLELASADQNAEMVCQLSINFFTLVGQNEEL